MEFVASAGLGMLLGVRHALEPDHIAAVTTLITDARSRSKAAWLGVSWGVGHALTLFATGSLLVVLKAEMPAIVTQLLDLCVLLLLIGFGSRAIHLGARRVAAGPSHTHAIPRRLPVDRWTLARPFSVGAVHGLAGSGAVTAIIVAALASTPAQLGYLLLFGVGSTVGMAALSGLLGWPLARLGAHHVFVRSVSIAAGSVSTALGLVWAYPLLEQLFSRSS